jgi:hypothetical protein
LNPLVEKLNATQIIAGISDNLASSKQHRILIFSGKRDEDPIKFMRVFLRVSRTLKWDDRTKVDKFPNYLSGAAEEWHYIKNECAETQITDWNDLKRSFEARLLRHHIKVI